MKDFLLVFIAVFVILFAYNYVTTPATSAPVPKEVKAVVYGVDGYYFEDTGAYLSNQEIYIKLWPSYESLRASTIEFGPDTSRLMAYTRSGDGVCEINIVDPKVDYRPEYFGHETWHCLTKGNFHQSQSK